MTTKQANPRIIRRIQPQSMLEVTVIADEKSGQITFKANKPTNTFFLIDIFMSLIGQLVKNIAAETSMIVNPNKHDIPSTGKPNGTGETVIDKEV